MRPRLIEDTVLRVLAAREGTACPSEIARALGGDWRALMQPVRDAAVRLQRRGRVAVLQRGKVVDASAARGPIRLRLVPSAHEGIDFRQHPEAYQVGRGEQGVLTAEPYKSELLPLWRFRTAADARTSAAALWRMFLRYRRQRDFVGMDMARKYLQMGFTRSRRYANHRSGRKYDAAGAPLPPAPDPEKAAAAEIFHAAWQRAERDPVYHSWRQQQRPRRSAGPSR